MGTVKKPSVVGEALFKPRWESTFFADFHGGVRFHRRSFFFAFFSSCASNPVFRKNLASGSPRNDDLQVGRPVLSPYLLAATRFPSFCPGDRFLIGSLL